MSDVLTLGGALVVLYLVGHALSYLADVAWWAFVDWKNKDEQ